MTARATSYRAGTRQEPPTEARDPGAAADGAASGLRESPLEGESSLDPFGVELRGVRLAELDAHGAARLGRLAAREGVVVAREQDIDDAAFVAFLARLGEPMFTRGETPVAGQPTLNVVTNVGRTRRPRSVYHTDTSYVARPPSFTALRAVDVPAGGGQTLFVSQYAALRRLPLEVRRTLHTARVLHRASGLAAGVESRRTWHPLVRLSREAQRHALFLSTPERCIALAGTPHRLGSRLLRYLYKHSVEQPAVYRHAWRPGDVVLWDNRVTLHRADHSAVRGDRTMHRGMVRGESPRVGSAKRPCG